MFGYALSALRLARENELKKDIDVESLSQDTDSSTSLESDEDFDSFLSDEDFDSFLLSSSDEEEEPVSSHRYPELPSKPYFTIVHRRKFARYGYQNTKPYRPSTSYQRDRLYPISEVDEDIWLRRNQQQEECLVPYTSHPTLPQNHEPNHDKDVPGHYTGYNNVPEQHHGHFQGHYRSAFVAPPATNPSHAPSHYNEYPQQHHHYSNMQLPTPQMGYPLYQAFPPQYDSRYCPPQGLYYGGGAPAAQAPMYQTEMHSYATTMHHGQTSGFRHNSDRNIETCSNQASYGSQGHNSGRDALETKPPKLPNPWTHGTAVEAPPRSPVYQTETYTHATLTPFTHREQRRLRKMQESKAEKRNPSARSKIETDYQEEPHHTRAATWGPEGYQAVNNVRCIATHGQAGWVRYGLDNSHIPSFQYPPVHQAYSPNVY